VFSRSARFPAPLMERNLLEVFGQRVGHVWTAPWQELSEVSAALVGCGHVSGLLMRRGWPLALMLCADQVPIVHMHLEVR
jgi:hypothetical protein